MTRAGEEAPGARRDRRGDSLFIGCALAFVAPRLAAFWPLGVLILGFLIFGKWNSPFMFLGGYTLLAVSATLVIAGAITGSSSSSTPCIPARTRPTRRCSKIYGSRFEMQVEEFPPLDS